MFALIRGTALCVVSVLCAPAYSSLSLIVLFQGSEWNAANFEELHKNKSVSFLLPTVARHLWWSPSHARDDTRLRIVFC